jgi:hypothetical protein
MSAPTANREAPSASFRQDDEAGTSFGAWTLVWTLYVTKLVTVVLVLWAAHSYEAAILLSATTWFWLGPALALGIGPLLFRYRLRRVRARRAALRRAEWTTEPTAASR